VLLTVFWFVFSHWFGVLFDLLGSLNFLNYMVSYQALAIHETEERRMSDIQPHTFDLDLGLSSSAEESGLEVIQELGLGR